MINFLASEKHYLEHLIPTYLCLPDKYRGAFYINTAALCQLAFTKGIPEKNIIFYDSKRKNPDTIGDREQIKPLEVDKGPETFFCSAMKDVESLHMLDPYKEIILCEHGSGQTFEHPSSSYAGGLGREGISLCIVPGEVPYNKQIKNYPMIPCVKTGCPKLDEFSDYVKSDKILQMNNLVVGFSTHFEDGVVFEASSAFIYFWKQLESLIRSNPRIRFIGHYHPRVTGLPLEKMNLLRVVCPNLMITQDFSFIARESDIYIIDQSSTAFEFMALDKPCLLLNSPHFRRNINHGMRFWEYSDCAVNCEYSDSLEEKVIEVLLGEYTSKYTERRREVTKLVYSVPLGQASLFTAQVLMDFVDGKPLVEPEKESKNLNSLQIIKMRALQMFVKDEGTLFPGIVFAPGYEVTLTKDDKGTTVGIIGARIPYIDPNIRCSKFKFDGLADYVYDQDEIQRIDSKEEVSAPEDYLEELETQEDHNVS